MLNQSLQAFKWNAIDLIVNQALNLLVNIWLVRLLLPEHFGIFAIPFAIVSFIRLIQDLDHSSLIIYDQNISTVDISAIHSVVVVLGFVWSTLCISICTIFKNTFAYNFSYQSSLLLTCSILIASFGYVPDAIMRKKLQYKKIFIINFGASLFSGIVGIIIAKSSFAELALASKYLAYVMFLTIPIYIMSDWKPKFLWQPSVITKFSSFTLPLIKNQIATFSVRNIDTFLIGKFLGVTSLGLYDRAFKILLFPITQITMTFTKVSLPIFSKLQSQIDKTNETYFLIVRQISFIICPLMLTLIVLSEDFVDIVFGYHWHAMIPILQAFCFVSILFSIQHVSHSVLTANGKTDQLFRMNLYVQSIMIPAMVIAILWKKDIVFFSYVYTFFAFVSFWVQQYFTAKALNINTYKLMKNYIPNFTAAAITAIIIFYLKSRFWPPIVSAFDLVIYSIITGFIYYFIVYFSRNKALKESIYLLKMIFKTAN